MSKPQADRPDEAKPASPPLNASVRRHLGRNLRTLYADSLSAPVSQRLESLIAQLDRPKT
ncbi:NepR family anti-sigma factor [uncultured Methylobacterium sp.]|uniref:NepR family anti-sigma factor n=1 Tax=uncultured Methylobacterium sp. TaxID=157278 RepID=UPI0035C98CAA